MTRSLRQFVRRLAATAFAGGFLFLSPRGIAALPEYEVKAALLVKLAKFVSWPQAARSSETFRICVLGTDPFGVSLDALRTERVGGRSIVVTRLLSIDRVATSCHLVFVSALDAEIGRDTAAQLASSGVLTISDRADFARDGGMIGMVTRDRKIAFEVNLQSLKRSGLDINSQLLQLSTVVVGTDGRTP